VIVPTEKVVEVRRGRKVDAERKFFPGYVLVKMEMTDQAFHLIKNTPKVTGFLGSDNKPMPISEAEAMAHPAAGAGRRGASQAVDHLRGRRAGAGLRRSVRVSFNGVVSKKSTRSARLKVDVSIFGRPTPVELEYGQVEKV
jgi:transcriptional antiterminator NusG